MHLTSQQHDIIESGGNIKINAVAGSGKTSTLIEYARRRREARRILYLAFNRSVRLEARRRFAEAGVTNVDVQTAHSLAYRHIVPGHGYKVVAGYKPHEIVKLLKIEPAGGDQWAAYATASHISRYAALFCARAAKRVDEVDYAATIEDGKTRAFARHCADRIRGGTRKLLAMMDRGEIPVTHEFYLKKFQLSQPVLACDWVLFDEGQDASPVMLDVFLKQPSTKVIVGDAHQQIYGWRHAVNALGAVDFAECPLTTSFRFDDRIAQLAMECLAWKGLFAEYAPVTITGAGTSRKTKSKATLARTNLFLLRNAIGAISGRSGLRRIYFEGNISSYTYAGDGASIYDVLNLQSGWRDGIRDPLIKQMRSFKELEEYAEESGDMEIAMMIDIVTEYGRDLPDLLKELKKRHVADDKRESADMWFSTVHRCKGMEYDAVTLEADFVTEERIKKLCGKVVKEGEEPVNPDKLAEEINLAYVAITRTKNLLSLPEGMFPGHDEFHAPAAPARTPARPAAGREKEWLFDKRKKRPNAGKSWSEYEDIELMRLYNRDVTITELARKFGRKKSAITSRLKRLNSECPF